MSPLLSLIHHNDSLSIINNKTTANSKRENQISEMKYYICVLRDREWKRHRRDLIETSIRYLMTIMPIIFLTQRSAATGINSWIFTLCFLRPTWVHRFTCPTVVISPSKPYCFPLVSIKHLIGSQRKKWHPNFSISFSIMYMAISFSLFNTS